MFLYTYISFPVEIHFPDSFFHFLVFQYPPVKGEVVVVGFIQFIKCSLILPKRERENVRYEDVEIYFININDLPVLNHFDVL